ncbi:MAG: MBL fold metallo-hydrolase [Rhodocyclaceae bacterium]|nr:MBL fold metallo-hydrolase [Rhodocyclaceae bacterium]
MEYHLVTVTPFEQNCSLLWEPASRAAVVIDPGGDVDKILAAIGAHDLRVGQILLTHGHIDHVGGAAALARQLGVPIVGPQREEAFWLAQLPEQSRMFGFAPTPPLVPDRWLDEGDIVTVGGARLEVLHTPGHTPGHVCFFDRAGGLAVVGDVLFAGSIGRSDFPRGDFDSLIHSIRGKLFPLGDDVEFIPGHGPISTFGRERLTNPYVCD